MYDDDVRIEELWLRQGLLSKRTSAYDDKNKMRNYDIKFPMIFQNSFDKVNQNWVPNVPEERIAECNKNVLKKLNK